MVRALKRLVLFGALVLIVAGCRVEVSLLLDVSENGSGTVTVDTRFDRAAAEAAGDLAGRLRLADLAEAGWEVNGPTEDDDGGISLVLRKQVPSADQWQPVLDELAGPGVFTRVRVEDQSEFARQAQRLALSVDLSDGWALFEDERATELFDGGPFGVPIEELTDGRSIDEVIGLELRATVSSDDGARPTSAVFVPRFDQDEPLAIQVESLSESSTAVTLRWVSYAAGALFVLATLLAITGLVLQQRSERLRRSRPEPLTSRVPGEARSPSVGAGVGADSVVRLVIVEPLSVLYQQVGGAERYLLPFVRHNGGGAPADAILEAYDEVVVGAMTTGRFWEVCGLDGDPDVIDEVFVKMRWLRDGAGGFLSELQRRRVPIAAITNDAVVWSRLARDRDRLSDVWPWLVSAELGTRKPDLGMFEILRRETGVAHEHCLYVDTDTDALDVAKDLGMRTTHFDPEGADPASLLGHPRITDLSDLIRRRS